MYEVVWLHHDVWSSLITPVSVNCPVDRNVNDDRVFPFGTGLKGMYICIFSLEWHSYERKTLASQRDARITHAIILTDSMNLLQNVESGMGCPDWHTAMHSLRLQRLLWIYCLGHAGVSGNERADRLASTADITSGLQLGRAEVLRGLRNFLSTDKPEHHSIDRLKERGVEKGSGRHSTLQGRERSVFNQTNIGTVSRATLGRLLRDGVERVWAFPSATMPSWAETETEKRREEFLSWPRFSCYRQKGVNMPATGLCISETELLWQSAHALRQKLHIKRAISSSHSALTPGQTVQALTL